MSVKTKSFKRAVEVSPVATGDAIRIGGSTMGGVVVGGAIGSSVLPGVGTVVGCIVGGAVGLGVSASEVSRERRGK